MLLGVEAERTKPSPPLAERAPDLRSSLGGRSDLAPKGLATEPYGDFRVRDLFGGDFEEEDEGGDLAEGGEGGGGEEDGCATSWSDGPTAHTPARKTIGRPKGSKNKTTKPPKGEATPPPPLCQCMSATLPLPACTPHSCGHFFGHLPPFPLSEKTRQKAEDMLDRR